VSLLTTILVGLLLTVIVVGMATLEVGQFRKAIDAEQSLRAYYTAEAGIEEAVRYILDGTYPEGVDRDCTPSVGWDNPGHAAWTCQQVTFSGQPSGQLEADKAKTIDPGPTASFASVQVEWDQAVAPAGYFDAGISVVNPLPSQLGYTGAPFAPPLELTVLRYPHALVSTNDVCTGAAATNPVGCKILLQNALFVPAGGGPSGTLAYTANGVTDGGTYDARCVASGGAPNYNCKMLITGFDTALWAFQFRVRTRYAGSVYKLSFFDGSGALVPQLDGTATIDVTARAGSSNRRVITKLPLGKGGASDLNYVLFSDHDICKNFQVVNENYPASLCN
jgi:hypothetical protein